MDGKRLAGLTVVFVLYLCAGSAVFKACEQGQQEIVAQRYEDKLEDFLRLNNYCVTGDNITALVRDLADILGQYREYVPGPANASSRSLWTYASAFTFTVTIVTTIGYGNIYPVTGLGRMLVILYAFIGIPVTLVILGGIGEQLSKLGNQVSRLNLRPEAPTLNKVLNMFILISAGIVLLFLIPSIVFTRAEKDWNIMDAIYYCFTTLTTIGFGDFVAGTTYGTAMTDQSSRDIYQVCVYVWILMGLSYISLAIRSVSKLFIDRAHEVEKKALKKVKLKQLSKRENMRRGKQMKRNPDNIFDNSKAVKETIQLDEDNNCTLVKISTVERY